MQLGPTAESFPDVTGTSSLGPDSEPPPPARAEDDSETHALPASEPPPAHEAAPSVAAPAKAPSTRPRPPAPPPEALQVRAPKPLAPARRDADLELGAPLLPERAYDPHYYPGISDDAPLEPIELVPTPWYKNLQNQPRPVLAAGGAVALLLLGLGIRGLFAGSHEAALVVDVTPQDARVTLDGEPWAATSGARKRTGLMNGEHVLAAEKNGFVGQRRVFTFDADKGDRRMVLALEVEPPPPAAAAPEPALAAPAAERAAPAEEVAQPVLSPRELAKQRRLERIRARRAAREASLAAGGSSEPKASKNATPGLLKLNAVPWAEVYIDRKHVGHTPLLNLPLPPGRHVIRLTSPSTHSTKTVRVKIAAGETVTQVVKL